MGRYSRALARVEPLTKGRKKVVGALKGKTEEEVVRKKTAVRQHMSAREVRILRERQRRR